jgi:hypothetical protein
MATETAWGRFGCNADGFDVRVVLRIRLNFSPAI